MNPTGPVTRTPGTDFICNRCAKCCSDRPGGRWTHGGLGVDAGDYSEVSLYSHVFLRFISLTQCNTRQNTSGLARGIAAVLIVTGVLTGIPPGIELLASIIVMNLGLNACIVPMDGALSKSDEHFCPEKVWLCQVLR